MVWKRFENTVKISSARAETVAFLVPHDPGNEQHIDSVEALGPNKLRPGFRNVEISRRKLFPEVFELREEKVNVSLLHNGNKNSLVAIQGLPNERTSVSLTALADITGNTSRADILVKMQNLIHDLRTLLFYVSSRLPISKSQNVSSELFFLNSSLCFCQI